MTMCVVCWLVLHMGRQVQVARSSNQAFSLHILYSGKFSREKTFTNWWRTRNSRRKLSWIAWRHQLGVGVAVDFVEKTFVDRHKTTKFVKVSPSKVSCYMVEKAEKA